MLELLAISISINCVLTFLLIVQDGLRRGAAYNERLYKQEMLIKEKLAEEWEKKYWDESNKNQNDKI